MSYGDLKVNKLVGESRDGVVEAEAVLARVSGREHVISLALLLAVKNHPLLTRLLCRSSDNVVNCDVVSTIVPASAGLNATYCQKIHRSVQQSKKRP